MSTAELTIPSEGQGKFAETLNPTVCWNIWFEVEDVLRFFDWGANPTGVPRVCLELLSAIPFEYIHLTKFCRLSKTSCRFEEIGLSTIRKIYPLAEVISAGRAYETDLLRRSYQLLRSAIPVSGRILRDLWKGRALQQQFERSIKPGEFIVSLGASWHNPSYATYVAEAKKRLGFKFAVLIHDVSPINHPYVKAKRDVARFRAWLEGILAISDLIFTASDHTRGELELFARVHGYRVPRVQVLRFGATVRTYGTKEQCEIIKQLKPFVLYVSSICVRKNQQMLIRIWRNLLQRHGHAGMPVLVLVGRPDESAARLMVDLKKANFEDGKIVVLANLSDAELSEAYQQCSFTVFPSLCEGWGLPVAETLASGKFCVASNRDSIPEVGSDFIDYFDPSDEADATGKIERAIFDASYLAERTDWIRRRYVPSSWTDCMERVMETIGELGPHPSKPT